jgi:hypothetical protein
MTERRSHVCISAPRAIALRQDWRTTNFQGLSTCVQHSMLRFLSPESTGYTKRCNEPCKCTRFQPSLVADLHTAAHLRHETTCSQILLWLYVQHKTMRLFPHTWEGLHSAFPSSPSPSDSHISIGPPFAHPSLGIISGQIYGICALACVATAGLMKHSNSLPAQRTAGFLFKTTALAATLGVAGSINRELGER